ncbi:hypothetical protein ACP4OV_012943 [Aristida adscensionis]
MSYFFSPPPPPWWERSPPPPPYRPPPRPPSPKPNGNDMSSGGVIAGVSIAAGTTLLFVTFMCSLCRGYRESRANAEAEAAAAAAVIALRPRSPAPEQPRHDEQQLREGHRQRSNPTAGLPSFTYCLSVKHNVTGGAGEEAAATCSVCLGAFQRGETVRLLPVCLHLYHVECIDPWLDEHSTCPICRSGTDVAPDGGMLPPV